MYKANDRNTISLATQILEFIKELRAVGESDAVIVEEIYAFMEEECKQEEEKKEQKERIKRISAFFGGGN